MRDPVRVFYDVIEGDALSVMSTLESASFDAVITDPPFGIGFDYGAAGRERINDSDSYWSWLQPAYLEMLRCVKPGGFIAIWQTQLYMRHFWTWFGDLAHVYISAKNFVQIYNVPINRGYDPVVMLYKAGAPPLRPDPRDPANRGRFRNIDFFVSQTSKIVSQPALRPDHPCPRPVDVCVEIVRGFTRPGARVLDPFAGSAAIGVACVANRRSYIGIENNAQHCALSRSRLDDAERIVAQWDSKQSRPTRRVSQ